jgi:hypothetical protein
MDMFLLHIGGVIGGFFIGLGLGYFWRDRISKNRRKRYK